MRRSTVILLGVLGVLTLLALAWGLASAADIRSTKGEPSALASPQPIPPTATATSPPVATSTPIASPAPTDTPAPTAPPQPTTAPSPATPRPPAIPPGTVFPIPPDRQRVAAPIDAASITVIESVPRQYVLNVTAGLPSGCAQPAGYETSRSGQTVRVQVYNSLPRGNVICTQIYGVRQLNIPLGSDYERGTTYTVEVNDKRLTFEAR